MHAHAHTHTHHTIYSKENEAEGMEQMKQEGLDMASDILTDDVPGSKKDCSIM